MKILYTAFPTFGSFNSNTSQQILENIQFENVNFTKLLVPVTIDESYKTLNKEIKKNRYDLIILTGMAASRKNITIESTAKNILNFSIPDNNGNIVKNKKISRFNPNLLKTKFDVDKLIIDINNEQVIKSNDAGEYICNYLYFKALSKNSIPIIFIHVPSIEAIELSKQIELMKLIITNLIKEASKD